MVSAEPKYNSRKYIFSVYIQSGLFEYESTQKVVRLGLGGTCAVPGAAVAHILFPYSHSSD